MTVDHRFEFERDVSLSDAEETLLLATFATEGIYGRARVQLEFSYVVDQAHRAIVINATTEVGRAVARVFTNLLLREFGEDAFRVRPGVA